MTQIHHSKYANSSWNTSSQVICCYFFQVAFSTKTKSFQPWTPEKMFIFLSLAPWKIFEAIAFICKYERPSQSHISCSVHSNTKQICTHISPRAWPPVCYIHGHNRGGCIHLVRLMCGCIPSLLSQRPPVCDLPYSSWAICWYRAGLLSGLGCSAGFFLSCVFFVLVCQKSGYCSHTFLLKNCQLLQRMTWFSSKFSEHKNQIRRDSGSRWPSVLLLPAGKIKAKHDQKGSTLLLGHIPSIFQSIWLSFSNLEIAFPLYNRNTECSFHMDQKTSLFLN